MNIAEDCHNVELKSIVHWLLKQYAKSLEVLLPVPNEEEQPIPASGNIFFFLFCLFFYIFNLLLPCPKACHFILVGFWPIICPPPILYTYTLNFVTLHTNIHTYTHWGAEPACPGGWNWALSLKSQSYWPLLTQLHYCTSWILSRIRKWKNFCLNVGAGTYGS